MIGRASGVVIIADSPWTGNAHPWHHLARTLTTTGTRVWFVPPPPINLPTPTTLARRLHQRRSRRPTQGVMVEAFSTVPERLPGSGLWNHWSARRTAARLSAERPAAIVCYTIGSAVATLVERVDAAVKVYVAVHSYPTYGLPERINSTESKIARQCSLVFADSVTAQRGLESRGFGPVGLMPPGVDGLRFREAHRGDELHGGISRIGYFGLLGKRKHDLGYLNACAIAGLSVEIVGTVDADAISHLHPSIAVSDPVSHEGLPMRIRSWDALVLPYSPGPINAGLVPAKIFECLATGKPVFSSIKPDLPNEQAPVVHVQSPDRLVAAIRRMTEEEFAPLRVRQLAAAAAADWERRCAGLLDAINAKARPLGSVGDLA